MLLYKVVWGCFMPYFIDLQTKLFNFSELIFEEKEKLDKFLNYKPYIKGKNVTLRTSYK